MNSYIKCPKVNLFNKAEAIDSIEARGFIFGYGISFYSPKLINFARKPGKLPEEIVKEKYNLEL